MPRPSHSRRANNPSAVPATPPHPARPATPELESPPLHTMNAFSTSDMIRAASGALPEVPPDFDEAGFGDEERASGEEGEQQEDGEEEYEEEEDELDEEEEDDGIHPRNSSPVPENLRDISSLASWTVSTHKPGCGVAALRHSSPSLYWQSDGPQPHALTLHFFKLVAVVRIRVYLDFNLDESYTPTKMVFLAGMGGNDLVEFASWEGEAPTGWVDIPLEGVGGRNNFYGERKRRRRRKTQKGREIQGLKGYDSGVDEDYDMENENNGLENDVPSDEDDDINDNDPTAGNVLKAMVIQMKICENHQNGKDTHVRGFQVFSLDNRMQGLGSSRTRRESATKSKHSHGEGDGDAEGDAESANNKTEEPAGYKFGGMEEPDWMGEPAIR